MRPSFFYLSIFCLLLVINAGFFFEAGNAPNLAMQQMQQIADLTGLAEPSFTNEARYTRHPGQSDSLVPFMDHPGALEHFPSSAMLAAKRNQ